MSKVFTRVVVKREKIPQKRAAAESLELTYTFGYSYKEQQSTLDIPKYVGFVFLVVSFQTQGSHGTDQRTFNPLAAPELREGRLLGGAPQAEKTKPG